MVELRVQIYYCVIIISFIHHRKSGMNRISNSVPHHSNWKLEASALPREDDLYLTSSDPVSQWAVSEQILLAQISH